MRFNAEKLRDMAPAEVHHTYSARDTMLYALGLGIGAQAADDPSLLRFVYEDGLSALPTMATVLGPGGAFLRDPALGVNWRRLLHADQALAIHHPLPASGQITSISSIEGVFDRGADKGALVQTKREIRDDRDGAHIATVRQSFLLRGDGGFGGPAPPPKPRIADPSGPPDLTIQHATRPDQALLYRLSGDYNPLHADPQTAEAAGFARPILHGLCTFGIAGFAAVKALCQLQPAKLASFSARFSNPVFPGDTIRTDFWLEDKRTALFTATAHERDVAVLKQGRIELETDRQPAI